MVSNLEFQKSSARPSKLGPKSILTSEQITTSDEIDLLYEAIKMLDGGNIALSAAAKIIANRIKEREGIK